jgi:hypothetical protein
MPMVQKFPREARFFYFHSDNSGEIKETWTELAKRTNLKISKIDEGKLDLSASKIHALTLVTFVESEAVKLSVFLYKNVVIISVIILPGSKKKDEIDFTNLPGMEVSIGGAIIHVTTEDKIKNISKELGESYIKILTKAGKLYQFEEKAERKEHIYAITSCPSSEQLEHLLTLHFPLFDFSIHKLHMERDYFQNQRKWVLNEKEDIDKTVGDILHKRIVGETLDPKYIGDLEKEIDILSSKYGILVNDNQLIRKAIKTLEDDIESIYGFLELFAESSPEQDLRILKHSITLKNKLREDEAFITYSVKNIKTAIDTVRTSVDLLRSRENIFLQEEAISFQIAAGVLEFIIIFYYGLTSWLHLIGHERFESISVPIRFLSIFAFASTSVALTHFVGESYRKKWKLNIGMIVSGIALLAVFFYIF